jgi:hypothetical protein
LELERPGTGCEVTGLRGRRSLARPHSDRSIFIRRRAMSAEKRRIWKGCGLAILTVTAAAVVAVTPALLRGQPGDDFRPTKVLNPLPPITEFPVKQVREVGDGLNPSELVIGVTVGKESRAYPVNMLTGPKREILNDTLGGKAIAATW